MNASPPSVAGESTPTERTPAKAPATSGPAAIPPATLSAEASGRRTLSTAFVRVGPDGYLTVRLRDDSTVVLRDVVVGAEAFSGIRMPDATKYRGRYADVAAATPGGGTLQPARDPGTPIQAATPPAPARRE